MTEKYPITTWMPVYEDARQVLRVLETAQFSQWRSMNRTINEATWNPENKGVWVDPDNYIPKVLPADDQDLAYRIWREAHVKPHRTETSVALAQLHKLAVFDEGPITLTEAGKAFLRNDESTTANIDRYEGLFFILREVADRGPGRESLFLDSFREFLHQRTTFSPKKTGFQVLRTRQTNLIQRGLIERRGKNYQVTEAGIAYLMRHHQGDSNGVASDLAIQKLASDANRAVEKQLAAFLQSMDPYQFEHLIKHLLEEMGYDNVEVTSATNDRGVDVVADIELGISRVREVIQVKRQQANVGRGILDSLRGSLHRFDAVRATIITTSGFSTGAKDAAFEKGAPPITLIDGETLLDKLIEHDIGIRRREIRILEFDKASLSEFDTEEKLDDVSSELTESE